jgi:hypothetical protein
MSVTFAVNALSPLLSGVSRLLWHYLLIKAKAPRMVTQVRQLTMHDCREFASEHDVLAPNASFTFLNIIPSSPIQSDMNKLFVGPSFSLASRLSGVLNIIFVALMYFGGTAWTIAVTVSSAIAILPI